MSDADDNLRRIASRQNTIIGNQQILLNELNKIIRNQQRLFAKLDRVEHALNVHVAQTAADAPEAAESSRVTNTEG